MNVVDLNNSDFAGACVQLGSKAIDTGFAPDVVLGIATGGLLVADEIKKAGLFGEARFVSTESRRQSTELKGGVGLGRLLKKLPAVINNLLRHLESLLRQLFHDANETRRVEFQGDAIEVIKAGRKILIVDDAVDSGVTLRSVIEHVKVLNSNIQIKTAVITVTWQNPLVTPDFQVYRNLLVRFPWSADAK